MLKRSIVRHVKIRRTIIDRNAVITNSAEIGYAPAEDRHNGYTGDGVRDS